MKTATDSGVRHLQGKEHPGLGEAAEAGTRPRETLAWRLQRECGSATTFILDFWPPELRENSFLLF